MTQTVYTKIFKGGLGDTENSETSVLVLSDAREICLADMELHEGGSDWPEFAQRNVTCAWRGIQYIIFMYQ